MPYTPEPLPTFTFKNGVVATIHHVGQMTIAHVAAGVEKKVPAVPVPTFTTDMGAGPVEQPNPADPAYQRAVAERRGRVNMLTMDKLIELALDIAIDQADLARVKSGLERIGEPIDEISDKVAYVKHCCVSDGSELKTLGELIRGELEAAADAAAATFSSDVPGAAAEPLESAPIRGAVLA